MLEVLKDLSKAFNIVDHNILLSLCCMKNNSRNWSSSYPSKRKQFVQAGCVTASKLDILFTTYIHRIY